MSALSLDSKPALTLLSCHGNQLTSLNVSSCAALEKLYCHDNRLTSLVLGHCDSLCELFCFGNQLKRLDLTGTPLILNAILNGARQTTDEGTDYYTDQTAQFEVDPTVILLTGGTVIVPSSYILLPASLTQVEAEAFAGSGAIAMIVPESVNSIGADAFPADATIYGVADSAAQTWAASSGSEFVAVTAGWIDALR